MTYYCETISSPVSESYIKSQYGINPAAEPARLPGLGIYPLVDCDPAYAPTHYRKDGDRYVAVPSPISNEEMAMVQHHRLLKTTPQWDAGTTYQPGDVVQHQGHTWKATSNNTGNEPDDVPGDWEEVK
jgi:hypothetical protein